MNRWINLVIDELRDLLLEKNRSYGNSVSKPLRIFSKVNTLEQINVRIDDKLSRLARGYEFMQEDTEKDLIGYLILKRAVLRKQEFENLDSDIEEDGMVPEWGGESDASG